MVSEVVETPAQPVEAPPEEAATEQEAVEEEESPSVDAPDAVEEAPEPSIAPEQVQIEPPQTYTAEQLYQQAQYLAAQQVEQQRRAEQSARDRAYAQQQKDFRDQAELRDLVEVAIARGDDPATINALLMRHSDKRRDQFAVAEQQRVNDAVQWLASPLTGQPAPNIDAETERYASAIGPWLQHAMNVTQQTTVQQLQQAGWRGPQDYDAAVKAGIQAGLKKAREGNKALNRPQGGQASSGNVMSWSAYMSLPEAERLQMTSEQKAAIMAADRKARAGQ